MRKNFSLVLGIVFFLVLVGYAFFVYKGSPTVFQNETPLPDPKPKAISILNFGDVMFDRGVRNIMENRGRDPFEYIKTYRETIGQFDVVIANLEGPIVEMNRSKCQQKAYNFQFASTTPDLLKSVGITMVSIANNHSYDCYGTGFESTKKYLSEAGIDYIGDKSLETSYVVKVIQDKKIAFVGMDETVAIVPIPSFYPLIQKLALENDLVVIHIHWGTEYSLAKTPLQESIAHTLVDSGASVVIGHHPHVIEPVEIYQPAPPASPPVVGSGLESGGLAGKGKAIFYSLGNFVFDQTNPETVRGIGVSVVFEDNVTVFEILPYRLEVFAPKFLEGSERESFCDDFLARLPHIGCIFEI